MGSNSFQLVAEPIVQSYPPPTFASFSCQDQFFKLTSSQASKIHYKTMSTRQIEWLIREILEIHAMSTPLQSADDHVKKNCSSISGREYFACTYSSCSCWQAGSWKVVSQLVDVGPTPSPTLWSLFDFSSLCVFDYILSLGLRCLGQVGSWKVAPCWTDTFANPPVTPQQLAHIWPHPLKHCSALHHIFHKKHKYLAHRSTSTSS